MRVLFVSSSAVITRDPATAQALYVGALGLPLREAESDPGYVYTEELDGPRHFGVWPLSQAAQSCFGTDEWPADRPVPQASTEFEVANPELVAEAEAELRAAGYALLHATKDEPWGQTVCRLQDADGALVGITHTPWMHTGG